jgi:hypothetical protein
MAKWEYCDIFQQRNKARQALHVVMVGPAGVNYRILSRPQEIGLTDEDFAEWRMTRQKDLIYPLTLFLCERFTCQLLNGGWEIVPLENSVSLSMSCWPKEYANIYHEVHWALTLRRRVAEQENQGG